MAFRGGRRAILASLTWVLLLAILAGTSAVPAEAGQERLTIAIVAGEQDAPHQEVVEGFKAGLRTRHPQATFRAYVLAGRNSVRQGVIREIRADSPRLILALGSTSLAALDSEFDDIPIVFGLVLAENARPRRPNVTGVVLDFPVQTQLQWLRRVLPEARTVGVVYHARENAGTIGAAEAVAPRLDLRLAAHAITSPRELPAALESLANTADAFWGISDPLVVNPQTARRLLLFSFRQRIPFIGLSSAWVKAGALFALDRDYVDIGRQCAELAGKILAGERAGELAIQTPRRIVYALNRRTAEQMRIELPTSLVQGAAEIY